MLDFILDLFNLRYRGEEELALYALKNGQNYLQRVNMLLTEQLRNTTTTTLDATSLIPSSSNQPSGANDPSLIVSFLIYIFKFFKFLLFPGL